MRLRILPAVAALLAGCAVRLPEPDDAMAGGDAARLGELREGRSLYVAKCSGCHSLIAPARYDDEQWPRVITEMIERKKLRLSRRERDRVNLYLSAANDRP